MAAPTINFIREIRRKRRYAASKDKRILRNVLIAAGLVIFASCFLLTVNWRMGNQVEEVVSRQLATRNSIEQRSQDELAYNYFVEKLKTLSSLFQDREGKKEAVSFFRALFPSEIKIAGLEYSMEDRALVFSIRSPSVFSLDQVIDQLDSPAIKEKFPLIEKQGIRRDENGTYSIGVNVQL